MHQNAMAISIDLGRGVARQLKPGGHLANRGALSPPSPFPVPISLKKIWGPPGPNWGAQPPVPPVHPLPTPRRRQWHNRPITSVVHFIETVIAIYHQVAVAAVFAAWLPLFYWK